MKPIEHEEAVKKSLPFCQTRTLSGREVCCLEGNKP